MKIYLVITVIAFTKMFASNAYGQSISLNEDNVKLKKILTEIERKSDFSFFYNNTIIDVHKRKSLTVKDASVNDVLALLFSDTEIEYEFVRNQIILFPKNNLEVKIKIEKLLKKHLNEIPISIAPRKLDVLLKAAIQSTIKGKVTDRSGTPILGVNVLVKNTIAGSATDFDGNYTIEAPATGTLMFSYVGYKTIEISVNNQSVINVVMEEDASKLDEVVVVGFGSQKKDNLTGATSSVDMADVLGNRPVTNPISAIQGTIPGLQITTNSGQPGASGLGINIRGTTSINGGSPLILMNNVPVSVEDINPQDVESISVLKDASATSIYGARAAFGVILITTKDGGKNQPIKFNYSSTFSFAYPEDIPDKASTYEFINAVNDWGTNPFWTGQDIPTWVGFLEEYKNNPSTYPLGYTEFNGLRYPLADTDLIGRWINDIGTTQIHNFNFSGGGEKTSYRVSLGYSDEDGIIITSNDRYKKFNINTSLKTELTDKLTSTTNIVYRNSNRRTPLGSYGNSISFNPYTPADGNHIFDDGTEVPYDTPANRELLKVAPEILNDNIRFFQKLDYELVKGFNLIGEYTFEKKNLNRITSDNQLLTANPERFVLNAVDPVNTYYRKENTQTNYKAINLYGKYVVDVNKHNISILAGGNSEESSFESFDAQRNNLINVDLPSLSGATGTQTTDDSFGEWAVLGYFGRINYNFDEKYFLELSGRYDGSSRFPKGNRFGFFPSFSAGWHLGRESFMESIDFLSSLKLRGSWGEIGNQNTSSLYPAVPGLGITDYGDTGTVNWLNEETGTRYSTLLLPNLVSSTFTWERVQTLNLGLDAAFFKNKLNLNFDWFRRNTLDMLAPGSELPAILGANAPLENVADLESTGWELALAWNDKIGDLKYNIGVTLYDYQSKISKFDNAAGLLSQYYVGQELGEIWGYTTDGYYSNDDFVDGTLNMDPTSPNYLRGGTLKDGIPNWEGRSQNPGDIKFVDMDANGIINDGNNTLDDSGDRSVIGNSSRRYQYGFYGNFNYKNLDFSFLANGVGKRDVYVNNRVRFPYTDEFSVVYKSQLDYWTPENTNGYFPRNYPLGGVNYGVSRSTQTKYMLNGAYLRIKNLTLGYSIPKDVLQRNGIDKLRLYVAGENLFSFNDYPDGINTELANKGSGAIYPYLKSYSIGLNLTF